ncbi:MAG: glycosyltransferase family 4 protein [Chitinophagaceae bacterium]|nr:glycosyltransferase family 4 protein [Chitinophagaceae bacterium]
MAFLQSLDIYVHASLGETMSTAIMQAMACKLPIVASDVNGINNMIIHGKTGILVPTHNMN